MVSGGRPRAQGSRGLTSYRRDRVGGLLSGGKRVGGDRGNRGHRENQGPRWFWESEVTVERHGCGGVSGAHQGHAGGEFCVEA